MTRKQALQYVKNTNGGATRENFVEDLEPIGEWLWRDLFERDHLITVNAAGRIFLSEAGEQVLKSS